MRMMLGYDIVYPNLGYRCILVFYILYFKGTVTHLINVHKHVFTFSKYAGNLEVVA